MKNQNITNTILVRILEHMSHIKLYAKYTCYSYTYSNIIINKLIFNQPCNALSKYKDFLLLNNRKEFLHRFYCKNEINLRLHKISIFYEKYTRIFPNYISLYEGKYLYKNIRKKQKMIDAVNKLIYQKDMMKEYEVNNNCFDNEIFKGTLFTDEVEYEIAKENMINNSNYINNNGNIGDSLFTQNSISLYLKNEIMNQNNNQKEIERKPNINIESFITNNESNASLFNLMDILNDNKIYSDDLKLLINNEDINTKNINYKTRTINPQKIGGIKEIIIKGNICGRDLLNNNIKRAESNNELTKTKNIQIENGKHNLINDKKDSKKISGNQFITLEAKAGKTKQSTKIIKTKAITNITKAKNNNKSDKIRKIKKLLCSENENNKKIFSHGNNGSKSNLQKNKKLLTLNNNTNEYFCTLQTIPGTDSTNNNYLLTKINYTKKNTEQKMIKTNIKDKNIKNEKKESNSKTKNNLNYNQLKNIKKYIRYKHASQDLCSNYYKSKEKFNLQRKHKLNICNSLSNTLDKINSKLKKESIISQSTIGTNSIVISNKEIKNLKKLNKSPIINNQIIIQNNNNYFLTENNNPNLITGTNKNKYDIDDNDSEREKLLIYLKIKAETQRTSLHHRPIISEEKSKEKYEDNILKNFNTENSLSNNRITMNNNAKCLKDLLIKQKTEKKFKKNYKYYFNHINDITTFNYPIIKYNTIRKMYCYKRNNSNFTEKLINSINCNGSISKIKKYNSNFSTKTEDFISSNKDISTNNTIKTINCYSHNENKNYNKNQRNNDELISKAKTSKIFKNNKIFLQVPDIIPSESSRNILSQYIIRNQQKESTKSLTKEKSKDKYDYKNTEKLLIDSNKQFKINSYKSINNKCQKNIKNERNNTDLNFKTYLIKNKFSSCDFDSLKNNKNNFSKGLLDRINNIKNKINEGILRNNKYNLLKKEKTQQIFNSRKSNNCNYYSENPNYLKQKKITKSKKIYENKIVYNDNKENIPENILIKVNKTKNLGNIKSHLYVNTDI